MITYKLYEIYQRHPKITIDSRKDVKDSIFFALRGENFNGNIYAKDALEKGAAFAVVDEMPINVTNEKLILVENCLSALTDLAIFHRNQMKIPFLAITGSNGKTTTKELIASVLSKKYNLLFTEGNLNNHIGVPLTILRLNHNHDFAVIEMGANHQQEIDYLCRIAKPDYGIITNIGKAHLEGFGGYKGVIKAKSELYKYILATGGRLFVNNNNPLLDELSAKISRLTYGAAPDADCHGKINSNEDFLDITWNSVYGQRFIHTQLFGSYNFENIMAAVCVGNYFKVEAEKIVDAIEQYAPANQRSQIVKTDKNTLIVDAYNANPTSMTAAIIDFNKQASGNKAAILGDMLELGEESLKEHQSILDLLNESNIEEVFLIGKDFSTANKNKKWLSFKNIEEFNGWLKQHPIQNRNVFIKGSRGLKLEKCLPLL